MRKSRRPIVIASRRSRLARAQAEAVGRALARVNVGLVVEFLWIESEGDRRATASLADEGGKGLFITAVENALIKGRADLAVHSLKDMPTDMTPGLMIAAIPPRADARDCLIAGEADTIADLPDGAIVGTSSPRRAAQLLRLRPDLQIIPFRGNVDTRLTKVLKDGLADATILAMAGLNRGGFNRHAVKPIAPSAMLPAAGQGALALQCRADDHVTISRCLPMNDATTAMAVHFERAVIAGLEGGCHSAIAVYAEPITPEARRFRARVRVLSADGRTCLERDVESTPRALTRLARQLASDLREQGADAVLATRLAGAEPTHLESEADAVVARITGPFQFSRESN